MTSLQVNGTVKSTQMNVMWLVIQPSLNLRTTCPQLNTFIQAIIAIFTSSFPIMYHLNFDSFNLPISSGP